MIDDLVFAELSASAYAAPPTWRRGDICAIRRDLNSRTTAVAFRGTANAADALRDARAWPAWDRDLGWCHAGFLEGARAVVPAMAAELAGRRVIFTGHSLGGALALVAGALFVVAGRPPAAIVTFGSPRAGFRALRRVLRLVPVRQYRLGDDPVTEVPWLLGLYVHARPPRRLEAPWSLDPFADHHIANYQRAMRRTKMLTRAALARPFSCPSPGAKRKWTCTKPSTAPLAAAPSWSGSSATARSRILR